MRGCVSSSAETENTFRRADAALFAAGNLPHGGVGGVQERKITPRFGKAASLFVKAKAASNASKRGVIVWWSGSLPSVA